MNCTVDVSISKLEFNYTCSLLRLQVGFDGTGKSTTVKLAAHITGCKVYSPVVTRNYALQDFRDDLKRVCVNAGVQSNNVVFLLTDSSIVKVFLYHICNSNFIFRCFSLKFTLLGISKCFAET